MYEYCLQPVTCASKNLGLRHRAYVQDGCDVLSPRDGCDRVVMIMRLKMLKLIRNRGIYESQMAIDEAEVSSSASGVNDGRLLMRSLKRVGAWCCFRVFGLAVHVQVAIPGQSFSIHS